MDDIKSFLRNKWPYILLFVAWIPIALRNIQIYWLYQDDGYDVVFSRGLYEKLTSIDLLGFFAQFLEVGGRFRPGYWIYRTLEWTVGHNSPQLHHLLHMLAIFLISLFIYLIISKITRSNTISLFGALLFLVNPMNTENLIRLGPQEVPLTLFISVVLYLVIENRKFFLTLLFLVLAIFTKETAIAFLPMIFAIYYAGENKKYIKNKRQVHHLWISTLILSGIVILVTLLTRQGYSTNYTFDLPVTMSNLVFYLKEITQSTVLTFPILISLFVLKIIYRLIYKKEILPTKNDFFKCVLLVGFFSFLLVQLPWKYPLTRYLMPTFFFLSIFMFIEINDDLGILTKYRAVKKYKRMLSVLLITLGVYVSSVWGVGMVSRQSAVDSYYKAFREMSTFPKDAILLLNLKEGEPTIEYVEETRIQLSEFWGRKDITVKYLDLNGLPVGNYVIVDSDMFLRKYPPGDLAKYKQVAEIKEVSSNIIITTPLELVKQIIKKYFEYLLNKKRFTTNGLYTYYYSYNDWYFYYEK